MLSVVKTRPEPGIEILLHREGTKTVITPD